jgi:hypothetical protein
MGKEKSVVARSCALGFFNVKLTIMANASAGTTTGEINLRPSARHLRRAVLDFDCGCPTLAVSTTTIASPADARSASSHERQRFGGAVAYQDAALLGIKGAYPIAGPCGGRQLLNERGKFRR